MRRYQETPADGIRARKGQGHGARALPRYVEFLGPLAAGVLDLLDV